MNAEAAQVIEEYDGSTPLRDPARERFCQEITAGVMPATAFIDCGWKRVNGNINRLMREPEIMARLGWLHKRVAALDETLLAYRRLEHRRALEHIATADRLDLFEETKTKAGKPTGKLRLRALRDLSDEHRALIDGIKISEKGAIELTMPKRLDARAMLARLDGFDKPAKIAATDPDGDALPVEQISDADRARALADFLAKARAQPDDGSS
jgi:hypothetical protein